VTAPGRARRSALALLLGLSLAAGAARAAEPPQPPPTPVYTELVRINALFQHDRPAAIAQLQALQDHMPAGATFNDRSKTLNTLINFYIDSGDARARRYIDELAALGARADDLESTLWAQNYRARVLALFDAKPADGALLAEGALAKAQAGGVGSRLAGALHDTAAMCHQEQGDFKSALQHQKTALGLLQGHSERDVYHRAVALNNISLLYSQMGDERQALDYNRQAQGVAEGLHAQAMLATLAIGRCTSYTNLKQPKQADQACQQSLALARMVGDKHIEAGVLGLLSNAAWQAGRYPACLGFAERAMALHAAERNDKERADALADVGLCHIGLGAVAQGEGEIRAALEVFRAGKEDASVSGTLATLATAYERAGMFKQAFATLREQGALQEAASQRELDRATLQMRSAFEATARQKEIASLQEKNRLQQAQLTNGQLELAVGFLIALLVAVVGFFKLRDKERSRRKAQQENHKKSQFVAEAAHDLRQPMQAIGNLLGAASHAIGRGDVDKSRDLIDTAQKATHAMRSSFNAVLELSRLESGAIAAEYSSFDLAELVNESVFALRPLSEARGVAIRLRLPQRPGRVLAVRSDRQLLGRVLCNLLSNAIKYGDPSRPGGAVVVVGVVGLGCHCRVDIVDNGIGIPDELQRQVFKPFFQADNPGRDRDRGLGLGLAIVDSILTLLARHTLRLRSSVGVGSRFSVGVPVAAADEAITAPPPAAAAVDPNDVAGLYVLYVEDDRLVRQSTEALLREYRVLCEPAGSIAELEALLPGLERMPDLVLTDFTLSAVHTARDVVRAVAVEFDRALPVIVLTGESEALALGPELEHAVVLRKPVASATLLTQIRVLCGER
jgi:signal transduction histidine kinase/CheY-like chemotaxis protein